MTDNPVALQTPPKWQGRSLDRITELARILTPIRPAGMSDEAASERMAVIAADTAELTDGEFLSGCRVAREECEDHRQVRKAILKGDKADREFYRKLRQFSDRDTWDERGGPRLGHAKPIGQIAAK